MSKSDIIGVNATRTPEQRSEYARKAGQASGRARRFAKTFKEAAMKALEQKAKNGKGEDINGREAIINSLMAQAVKGNIKAAQIMIELVGEAPIKKMEVEEKHTFLDFLMETGTED